MAILVKLDDVLYARRMTLTELSGKVGITLANLSILKNGRAKGMRFATLDAICDALECEPGDLLKFERTGDDPKDEADRLAAAGGNLR